MKKIFVLSLVSLALAGCMSIQQRVDQARFGENPYLEPPFYARYLNTGSDTDARIQAWLTALASDPQNPMYHNELGRLLIDKRLPNDAKREFRRAIAADRNFYPAWYNLALVRASEGDTRGALRALDETLDRRPGHASARFQKGLLLERLGKNDAAIEEYARAFRINWKLLQPSINPQIIESRLIDRTLMKVYPDERQRRSLFLQPTPPELIPAPRAPSDLSTPDEIVPPASDTPPQPTPATPALPPPAG
jgi:tetratricopeptide (TPR) repeat protein